MYDIPDHPDIRMMELYGPPAVELVHCPVCGYEDPESLIRIDGDIVGCTHCVELIDPYDWADEQIQKGENPYGH